VHSTNHPATCVSISWGGPENSWTEQALRAFDGAFADANALGVTVLCAAGDHGAADGESNGAVHADFPASSPHAVACGGTTLVGQGGHTVSEVVWNDGDGWATGGGISQTFPAPSYQSHLSLPPALSHGHKGRGLPDVAGNADIKTGYICLVNGQLVPIGGTSAVAPLYAGLTALLAQGLGHPLGDLNAALYGIASSGGGMAAFRDITEGDNSVPKSQSGPATAGYKAAAGWDACTGLGSLHGTELLSRLKSSSLA
jgi:kumamolisin